MFALLGTDYVYPRTTNKILRDLPACPWASPPTTSSINYTPFGHSDWQSIVAEGQELRVRGGKKTAVVSTINGDG